MDCSEISGFYAGRSVFITGATGFMGKVLIEKLLRSCPDIKYLYLLMRPKKGVAIQTRLQDFINAKLFDVLKKDYPQSFEKLIAVAGDISLPGLGISADDLQMLKANVSVVFHLAATIRFNDELKIATQMNIKGTAEIIKICKNLDSLKALVHVSTAYANCVRKEVDEKVYSSPTQMDKMLQLVDGNNENLTPDVAKSLVDDYPNTYTFTKFMAELLLLKECDGKMPLSIIRPSIVTASFKEPVSGWIDNINGPTGLIFGVSRGFLRTIYCGLQETTDLIPVDYSTNLMIASAWYSATYKPTETIVYHSSTSDLNPLSIKDFYSLAFDGYKNIPNTEMMWYPTVTLDSNPTLHSAHKVFYHYIPAYVMDLLTLLTGKRPFLVKLYDKAHRAISSYGFFNERTWRFKTNNWQYIFDKMAPQDRSTFNFDVSTINWRSYMKTYCHGIRQFIQKDDPDSVPLANKKLQRLYIMHQVLLISIVSLFAYFLYALLSMFLHA